MLGKVLGNGAGNGNSGDLDYEIPREGKRTAEGTQKLQGNSNRRKR